VHFKRGQEGEFQALDALGRPGDKVSGKILALLQCGRMIYALIRTADGLRSVRLT
jgi:hypothetical protein